MKWNLAAGLATVLVMEMHAVPPADACDVKLTAKSSGSRKAVAHTSNPSDVLLLGNPPRRLELDLTAAGHRVEVAPTVSAAKRKSYAVVSTDANLQDDARSNFPGAVVIVRSGDVIADTRSVEQQVARRPVRTEQARTVVRPSPRVLHNQSPAVWLLPASRGTRCQRAEGAEGRSARDPASAGAQRYRAEGGCDSVGVGAQGHQV